MTIGDLLEHVPFRHEDFREARRMADMQPGEEATIVATVIDVRQRPTRRRNLVIVEARVRDDSGPGVIIWFNQRYVARQLSPGTVISVRGERRASIGAEIAAKRTRCWRRAMTPSTPAAWCRSTGPARISAAGGSGRW